MPTTPHVLFSRKEISRLFMLASEIDPDKFESNEDKALIYRARMARDIAIEHGSVILDLDLEGWTHAR